MMKIFKTPNGEMILDVTRHAFRSCGNGTCEVNVNGAWYVVNCTLQELAFQIGVSYKESTIKTEGVSHVV